MQIYPGIVSLVANLLVAIVVTMIVRAFKVPDGPDSTHGEDYHVDEDDADLRPIGAH
jgi:SSS family solute:Na+ symporter